MSDEFRREIRIDPITGDRRIILPNVAGDISRILTSTRGEKIDFFSSGKSTVTVTSPEVPLFLLEETPMSLGDETTVYDRVSGFGADERFAVNCWSQDGLELLIEAFKARSDMLQASVVNGKGLGQNYPYALYDPRDKTLKGVLLASREIPPRIMQEVKQADAHLSYKRRTLHKDLHRDEAESMFGEEHRVVDANGDYMAIVPFATADQHSVYILPVEHHTPRLTGLTGAKIKSLADLIYKSVYALQLTADEDNRSFSFVYIAIHSAPVIEKPGDRTRFGIRNNPAESYDLHVEIKLDALPFYNGPYVIPASGWSVAAGRPKQTAKKLRIYLNNHP